MVHLADTPRKARPLTRPNIVSVLNTPIPVADAARLVGLTPRALQMAAAKGRLKAWRPGGRWYTTLADVYDYLRYQGTPQRQLRLLREDLSKRYMPC